MRGLKMMAMTTMRNHERSPLTSQKTIPDASDISASVLGTARARESGRLVNGSVLWM